MDEEKNTLPRVGADGPAPQEPEAPAAETAAPENTPKPDQAEAKKDPQDRGRRTVFYGAAGPISSIWPCRSCAESSDRPP